MNTKRKPYVIYLFLLIMTSLLYSCGGDSNSSNNNGGGGTDSGNLDVVITVLGAVQGVEVTVGSEIVELIESENLSYRVPNVSSSSQASISAAPESVNCVFEGTNAAQTTVSARMRVVCERQIDIIVSTRVVGGEDVVDSANINLVVIQDGEQTTMPFTSTGTDGEFWIEDALVSFADRMFVTLEADGYVSNVIPIGVSGEVSEVSRTIEMTPTGASTTYDPTTNDIITSDGVSVSISANTIVDSEGNAPAGNLNVIITNLDPSNAAEVLPGNYSYLNESDSETFFEVYGAVDVQIMDNSGNSYQLADGATISLSIPVAVRATDAPATATGYNFNASTGYYEASMTELTEDEDNGVYTTTISQIGTWAAGASYTAVRVTGCIVNANGQRLRDIQVIAQGQDYIGRTITFSDADGNFSVNAKASSQVLVFSRGNGASRTFAVNTGTGNSAMSGCIVVDPNTTAITLSWGENPSDLDSHLWGPNLSGGEFHVDYNSKTQEVGTTTIYLDVDDVTSFGPEVTTIPTFPTDGTYDFYVHLFAGTGSIFSSPTRVSLYTRGQEYIYTPDSIDATRCWYVFSLVVENGEPTVVARNEWVEVTPNCSASAVER